MTTRIEFKSFAVAAMAAVLFCHGASPALADDKAASKDAAATKKMFAEFENRMKNVKLVGQFTIVGRPNNKLAKEEYTITSVKKLADGDLWAFATRIKYGNIDVPVTLNLPVKWAGDTPVISLTDLTIPGLGTFSARVVLDGGKYAGTWTHGKVGGHMFGTIEKNADKEEPKKKTD